MLRSVSSEWTAFRGMYWRMGDAIANTMTSANDFEFSCDDETHAVTATDFHRLIPNRRSVLLYSVASADVVASGKCWSDGDWPVDRSHDDWDSPDRKSRLVPHYFYSRWKKSKFHSYNNETQSLCKWVWALLWVIAMRAAIQMPNE